MDDDDSGTSEEYEIVTPKMMEQPQLNIANNGDINDLRMSLQDVLIEDQVECLKSKLESTQETVKAVGQSVFYSNLSCNEEDKIEKEMTQSMIDTDQECTLFSGVTYLGSAAINAPKSEKEIQRNMTILNEQSGDNGIKVSVSIPCSSDGTVVLYDSSSAVIAEYEIHRILYYAKGNAESNEAPCFAFTWSHGETQESAVFQCHVFRCDIPEAVGQVSSCFAKAFQRIPKQTANSMTSSVRTSLYDKEIFTFQVTMGIKEDDGHGSFSFAPRDSTQFILRENVEKQICLTVDQISEHGKELEVERCFGVLLTPGRYHKDSDLQLLEMHASKGSETGENSSYIIYGHWDPLEPAFEDLNSSNFQTYLTVAVDLVIKGIQEPVRFVIETLVRKFKKTDHIWYFNRKTMTQNFLLHLKEVPSNDLSVIHYEVISLESVPLPDKTFQLSLSSLISSTSILDLDTLTPSNEELSDGDEPLLSGTGEVSKDCTEVELESWADVLTKWTATKQQRPKQLAGLVRNGIPEALRGEVWQRLAGCENSNMMETYRVLITRDSRCEAVIQRDINRTFPAHNFFKEAGGLGQDSLYRISKAYAVYDTEVGYCQGLSFLAATLLLHMPEEQAFCVLVSLMYDYGLRDLYKDGFEDLYLRLYQLTKLMEEQLPKLWQNFQDKGIECHMFAAQWFLTVFTARFPLYFVFHILDVFLLQGIETLFQVALALLMMCKKDLLSLDFEGTLKYFRVSLPKRCRSEEVAKHIMKLATSLKLKKLKKFEQEFLQLKDNQDSEKNYIKQIEWLKLNLVRLEEEKKELEEEAMQVKEMLKREIQRAESESSRNKAIITDYKQICQRLDDEKVSAKVALNDLRSQISSCKDCRHLLGETVDQPANNRAMNNGADPLTLRSQERIHELELELAQTKLARVEAECLNQDLLHKLHAAIAEAQMSKSTWPPWLQKTLSSIKEVAKKDGKEPCNKKEGPAPSPKRRDSAPAFPPDSHCRDAFH